MKILCFIDNFGSGGAQRQMVNLILGLKNKGFDITTLIYFPDDFYMPVLKHNNVYVEIITEKSKFKRLFRCRAFIRKGNFDAIISFLETPSLIAELSSFPFKKWKLIVGERSSTPAILYTFRGRFLRLVHVFADYVVSNSNTNRILVKRANPFLKDKKNKTIYNIYDLEKLDRKNFIINEKKDDKFHILVAASHQKLKNLKNLALAIYLLDDKYKSRLSIDWYGKQVEECFNENQKIVSELGLNGIVHFYPPTLDIYQKMIDADAVGLFSLYEGLSNTVCEAMCLGMPVITTDVSDNRDLIDNQNLISDATSAESISESLVYLMDLPKSELIKIGTHNRLKAESLFNNETIINQYISLIQD